MKAPLGRLCCITLFCFLLLLSSCSTRHKTAKAPAPPATHKDTVQVQDAAPSSVADTDEESTLAEPEESATEEIAELSKPGAWDTEAKPAADTGVQATGYELSGYDFPVVINRQVNYYLDLFQGKQRKQFARWLSRSSRYMPAIEAELLEAGLPRDLAMLAMIESGFNPSAVSRAGAGGLWQFMPATGRRYDLNITPWVDERRNPDKATRAAIRYLSRLYQQFNDWYLAVAAYNTGEGMIERAIKKHGSTDFWDLAASEGIYMETKRYVPKLIAAIIIARNPEVYGFDAIDYLDPHAYEVVSIPAGTDLHSVASTAGTSVQQLRTLNNELLKNQTPPKGKHYALRVPPGCKTVLAANMDQLRQVPTRPQRSYATHVVKKGETLQSISRQYQVSMTDLLKSNKVRAAKLQVGQRLQIPVTGETYIAKGGKQPGKQVARGQAGGRQDYRVRKGDTLAGIARQHGVSVAELKKWNALKDNHTLQPGQHLALHAKKAPSGASGSTAPALTGTAKASVASTGKGAVAGAKTSTPAVRQHEAPAKQKHALVAKAPEKKAAPAPAPVQSKVAAKEAGQRNKAPQSWYVVQQGDSMWTIAKKFSISVEDIRQWNNLSSNKLQAGNRLRIKKG